MGWTTPATLVTGDVIQASWANTHVRDNERYLKGLDGGVTIQDSVTVTGSLAPSVGVNVGGETGALTGEVKAKAGRFTDSVSFTGGMANEIGVSGGEAFLQAFNRTGGSYGVQNIVGNPVMFKVSGTEKGRVNSTGFSGDGSQLTNLAGSQVVSALADAALSGKNISLLTNNSGYLTSASSVAATQLTGGVLATSQSIANNGTYTICAQGAGGLFVLRDSAGNFGILYLFTGPLQSEISDPFNVFSFSSGTASSWNLYITGGNITIENKRGSTLTINIVRLAGG